MKYIIAGGMRLCSYYEMKKCELLAIYHPFSYTEVINIFIRCRKSFDNTEKVLELACAYNSLAQAYKEVIGEPNE